MEFLEDHQALQFFYPDPPEDWGAPSRLPLAKRNLTALGLASVFGWRWIRDIAERIPPQGYVLQVDSASGWLLLELAKRRPDCSFIGLEGDEEQVQWAEAGRDYLVEQEQIQYGQVEFKHKNIEDFDYSDNALDMVLAPFTMGMFEDVDRILTTMQRWLKPEGLLFYYEAMDTSEDVLNWGARFNIVEAKIQGRDLDAWNARRMMQDLAGKMYVRRISPSFVGEDHWLEGEVFDRSLALFEVVEEESDRVLLDWLIGKKLFQGSLLLPVVAWLDRILGLLKLPRTCRVAWLKPQK